MTNLPKMSNRAQEALGVLADGGVFVNRLERNGYTGREQFRMRLQRNGSTVPGFGHATFRELEALGFLVRDFATATSVSSPYVLAAA